MADTKISALTALLGTGVDTAADLLAIVDTSAATTKKILIDELRIALLSNTLITNSLASDVNLNNTASYFDGPSCAQGTTGTWLAVGTITCLDTSGLANFYAKLHDGTNIYASAVQTSPAALSPIAIALSARIVTPVGNIRISVRDATSTSGVMKFNSSGLQLDSTLTVIRIG